MKTRVLIVDDSSVIRTLLKKILTTDPEIEVVGMAADPYEARELLVSLRPDVMTLDIEMPKMDGITFLEKVMAHFPTPTVILSSLSTEKAEITLKAFELGAVDVVAKPVVNLSQSIEEMAHDFIPRVKAAARSRIGSAPKSHSPPVEKREEPRSTVRKIKPGSVEVIAIASSTGGTEALKVVLRKLPADIPPIVVVQHMPPGFTKKYAETLQNICEFEVKEAQEGDKLHRGQLLIAPGNFHLEIKHIAGANIVRLNQGPILHGVRPAADFMMRSIAKIYGKHALGIVLTGMGRDGAEGLLAMREAGSFNIAQDEETCVVFGMPREAIALGAIDEVVQLDRIYSVILDHLKLNKAA
jgi:two-component system chemotaxis response regulator CheB